MSFVKFICYKLIPYTLLLMFVAFGLAAIFGQNATYMQQININGSQLYQFDLKAYITNLAEDKFSSLAKFFNFDKVTAIFEEETADGTWWKVLMASFQWFINLVITVINIILVMPIQIVIILLQYILGALGLNMNADWWLATGLRWIQEHFQIPLWQTVTSVTD